MLSNYFKHVTKSKEFAAKIAGLIEALKGKKVLIYGAGEGFVALNKRYKFAEVMNIVGISDIKFTEKFQFCGLNAVPPSEIVEQDFDVILVTNEQIGRILVFLTSKLGIDENKIEPIFSSNGILENNLTSFLEEFNLKGNLKILQKKLKNKQVIIYTSPSIFQVIKENYDIDALNVIGVSHSSFAGHMKDEELFGYKIYSPDELSTVKPAYLLVGLPQSIGIIEKLQKGVLKDSGIKIKLLIKKSFWDLCREIWL